MHCDSAKIGGTHPTHVPCDLFLNITFLFTSVYFKLIIFFAAVTAALMEPGKYPGSSGTRNLHDNISDLRAQVAANHKVSSSIMPFSA